MAISKASTSSITNGLVKSKFLKTEPVLPVRTGLIMWYDASNRSSLSLSGASVTQWNDLSGNGRHASGGSSPQYVENALNGRAAVDFGTDGQYRLSIANPVTFASMNCHFFAVAKSRKESNTDNSAIIGKYGSSNGALVWSFPGNGGTAGQQQFLNNALAWATAGNKNDYVSTTFYNVNAALNASTATYRASRADDGGGGLSNNISNPTDALGHQEGTGSSGGNVTIAELICFGSKLSDANRNLVENYLFDKWGV